MGACRAAVAYAVTLPRYLIDDLREYFDQRMDVNWEGTGPNEEMTMLTRIDEAIADAMLAARKAGREAGE